MFGAKSKPKKLLVFREDTGRHNVFDKLYGRSIRNRVDITDKILIFSGRCTCEMIMKLRRMGIPAVLAKSVPTTPAIGIATDFGRQTFLKSTWLGSLGLALSSPGLTFLRMRLRSYRLGQKLIQLEGAAADVNYYPFLIDEKQVAGSKLKEQFDTLVYALANG